MAVARGRQGSLAHHISTQAHRCLSAGRPHLPLSGGGGGGGGGGSSSSSSSSGSGGSLYSPFAPRPQAAGPLEGPAAASAAASAAAASGAELEPQVAFSYSHRFSSPSSPSSANRRLLSSWVTSDDTPRVALGGESHGGGSGRRRAAMVAVTLAPISLVASEQRHFLSWLSSSSSPSLPFPSAPSARGVFETGRPRRSLSLGRSGSSSSSSTSGSGGGDGASFVIAQRLGRPRKGGEVGAKGGVLSSGGRGYRRRGFASASNPPEQYLRYIHRVKTETPEEAAPVEPPPNKPISGRGTGQSRGEDVTRAKASPENAVAAARGASRYRRSEGDSEDELGEDDAHGQSGQVTRRWLKGFKAKDILRDKSLLRQQLEVRGNSTVDEAITAMVNQMVTAFVVVNRRKEVIGMFTSRDLLGELARYPSKADGLKTKAHEFMIPLGRMIYCSPNDSLYQCLLVMSELKVRNLPVVWEGKVLGIVNVNDISDFSFSMEELGGKKAYMKNISQRKGLPKGVGLDPRQNRAGWKQNFSASVGAVALPHPHKTADGFVSANTREHRHLEVADDPTLSEDAHFVLDVAWPTPTTDTVNYVGLADGVGSWRKVGVDPREFSCRLMHWAREYILSTAPGSGIGGEGRLPPPPPKPHEVLMAAWEYTVGEKVVGSSTACVAALDYDLEQLTFSNIGDCGVVVLRHIDSDVAGYMREKRTPRYLRDSDLRLAFISQQQLRSFNLPYQFGYTNVHEDNANFETPRDAVNTSFPVRPGDIIILATDGLFDNMELENISAVALEWENKWFGGPLAGLSEHNNAAMEDLAEQLGHRARELSLDSTRDSPFALLAKENDIMWGGGMPDDITVVALRVINKADSPSAAVSTRGVNPDDQHAEEAAVA